MLDFSKYRNYVSSSSNDDVDNDLIGNIIELQVDSYDSFLRAGIHDAVKSIFPISCPFGSFVLDYVSHEVKYSIYTPEECVRRNLTYSADVYVRLRLYSFEKNGDVKNVVDIKEQDVLLCTVPLMTQLGTFIVNGVERVVVSQIHRSPGVFFTQNSIDSGIVYSANIIPYRGTWIDFVFETAGSITVVIDKRKKIPLVPFLYAVGFLRSDVISSFYQDLKLTSTDGNMLQLHCNISNLAGERIAFNVYNKNGDVVLECGKVVTNKKLKDFGNGEIFVKFNEVEDLLYLYDDLTINKDITHLAGTPLKGMEISDLFQHSKNEIKIIDFTDKSFSKIVLELLSLSSDITCDDAVQMLFKLLRASDRILVDDQKEYVASMFFSKEKCDMLRVGRYKMNAILGLSLDENSVSLTKEDFVKVLQKLIKIKENLLDTDDIDHLGNRRIRAVGELVENAMRSGLSKLARSCVEIMSNFVVGSNASPSDAIISNHVLKAVRDFFAVSQLSQFMEQTNPLSEVSHKRRISALGAGGVEKDRAGLDIRDVHPTHYGRICIVETPDSQSIGLISNLATFAKVNKYGFIESPYRVVKNRIISDEVVYLDSTQEIGHVICQYEPNFINSGVINNDVVSCRKDGELIMSNADDVSLIDISYHQMLSLVSGLIPFFENNDAYRVLMGANMQRQAVPLIRPEAPLVGTGIEAFIGSQSSGVIRTKTAGTISYVDSSRIIVRTDTGALDVYTLSKYKKTNQGTSINYKPIVDIGSKVLPGDVIADGYATDGKEIAIGKNTLVAFMSWNGFGYEDSVIISDKIVNDESFTSVHIEEFEIDVLDTRLGPEVLTRDIPGIPDNILYDLDESGIVHLGAYVQPGDILVGKVVPKVEIPITPEEKLLRAIFDEKVSDVKDSSLRVSPGCAGIVVGVDILTRRGVEKPQRLVEIETKEISVRKSTHDKVLSVIKDEIIEEILKSFDSSELVRNSKQKGVISISSKLDKAYLENLNINDIFKIQLTNQDKQAKFTEVKSKFSSIVDKIESDYKSDIEKIIDGHDLQNNVLYVVKVRIAVKSRMQPGDKVAGRHGNKGIISKVVPAQDMPFTKDGRSVDMIINPLGIVARMNFGQVLEMALGLASLKLGDKVKSILENHQNIEDVKTILSEVSIDKSVQERISKLSDEEAITLAKRYSKGVPFATPVFHGCKVADLDKILGLADCDLDGQVWLYDGLTGEKFDRKVSIGCLYILKLHHLVDTKVHARSVGPYSLVTQQPLGGKSHFGGQRLGEMECWALQAYGAAYTLQEMLTVKSDDIRGRKALYNNIVSGNMNFTYNAPESFNVMLKEMSALGLNVSLESDK